MRERNNPSITIISAPCGTGKTEYAIRYMNAHQDHPYLYLAPLRKVFDRLEGKGEYADKGVTFKMLTPVNFDSSGRYENKIDNIQTLIAAGQNIMSTHQLFLAMTEQMISDLQPRHYHLIIDEALDAITVLSNRNEFDGVSDNEATQRIQNSISRDDIILLRNHGMIHIDEEDGNRVCWNDADGEEELKHRFSDVRRIIKTGCVFFVDDSFLIWTFPKRVLEAFEEITVLTYRFHSSLMQAYLDFFGLPYTVKSIVHVGNDLQLTDFNPNSDWGHEYSNLIDVCMTDSLNSIGIRQERRGQYPFSGRWYTNNKRQKTGMIKAAKNNLRAYLDRLNPDKDAVMWTTFKQFKNKLQPKGYTKRSDGQSETFASCNCRATEEYGDRFVLAYMVDRHLNPGIVHFLAQRSITIDEDEYALSELIQWVFRSRIRFGNLPDEDRKINLYIPSERMRNLLLQWMGRNIPQTLLPGTQPARSHKRSEVAASE